MDFYRNCIFMGHDIVIFVAMFYLHNVQLLPCLWPEVVLKSGLVFPVSASALHNPKRFSLIIITSSSMSSLWQPCTSLEGELGCQTLPRKYFYASSANISSKVQQNIFVIVTRNTFIKEVRTILKRRKRADLVVQFLATEAH